MMIEVGSYDAKTRLPELLRRVEAGETVTITRRGKPIARIVPADADRRAEIRQAIEDIKALRSRQEDVTVEEILSARDEGRRF
jgi:prevent-host-death family protein